jgi:hypothetical protein
MPDPAPEPDAPHQTEPLSVATLRRLTPVERLHHALALTHRVQRRAREGLRRRHPEYSERELDLAAARLRLGEELFARAFPESDVQP